MPLTPDNITPVEEHNETIEGVASDWTLVPAAGRHVRGAPHMSKELAEQLEALVEKATSDTLMMYGEPEVGLRTEPFFGTPMEGGMRPLADWCGYDADLVIALWNARLPIIAALRAEAEATELREENARLREALEDVINPLGYIQRYAAKRGQKLSDMAYAVANDPGTIRQIARKALENRDG